MTVKRFELCEINCFDYGIEVFNEIMDNGVPLSQKQVCEFLNELYEENQALKSDRARYEEECRLDVFKELYKENEELKKALGAILLEVKRDISNTNQTGEIRVFINPNSFNLISEVLRKYGALKEWYK